MIGWSPFEHATADMPVLCPLCGGYGEQKCLNCLGEGAVPPLKGMLCHMVICRACATVPQLMPLSSVATHRCCMQGLHGM